MADKIEIRRASGGLVGEVVVPGDKSISHRSVMFSGLGEVPVRITNFLHADDCISTARGMESFGVSISWKSDGDIEVRGNGMHGLKEPDKIIDAGDSGTMLRLLVGLSSPQPFLTTFTGDAALYRRPMGRVIKPLLDMGAQIFGRDGNRLLPITVAPSKTPLHGIAYEMPVASAQVKSSVLLAGLFARGETTIKEPAASRDHTERMMRAFGIDVRTRHLTVSLTPVDEVHAPEIIEVPGDISSAAFWMVAASVIDGSDILLRNVGVNSTRTGVIDVLIEMGADITLMNRRESGGEEMADIRVRAAKLHGVRFGGAIIPRLIDEIPAIAVAALFANGDTEITGAGELRVKETDRISAVAKEFSKLSPCVDELTDGLVIHGKTQRMKHAECFSYDDHRIAMSLAIAGAAGDGVTISNPECASISYPSFYETLERLRK